MSDDQMPNRFSPEGVQVSLWAIHDPSNAVVGRILEKQERRKGDGEIFVIELTEPCRGRDGDREVKCTKGDIVGLDVKQALGSLEKHVGKPVEVYIRPIEQVPTKDGQRTYWKYQLGSARMQAPK